MAELRLDELCRAIAVRIGDDRPEWDWSSWTEATQLRDDLLLDSFDMLRLGILIEELADFYIFELGDIVPPTSLGDVYAGYLVLCAFRDDEASA